MFLKIVYPFCLLLFTSFLLHGQPLPTNKCGYALHKSLEEADESYISVHIVLTQQLDYGSWNLDASNKTAQLKSKQLILQLQAIAQESQVDLMSFLQKQQDVIQSSIKKHWIVNAISCRLKKKLLKALLLRNDVYWINENAPLKINSPSQAVIQAPAAPNKIEKGLAAIGAPKMWELGYTGYNRLALIADTGVDPKHAALKSQYNGYLNFDYASWYSLLSPFPKDCDGHGTHVAGTILGLDRSTNDTIGVAFNARWIAGGILCGIETEDNIGVFEWALNPDGDVNTSHDIPDVINNSWYDPNLTELDCYSVYVPLLEALEAAGVAVVFSAGNEGPDGNTITQPHNINVNEVNSFTVGALNGNSVNLPIASFSSNGPSHCLGEGSIKIKPEVSAPGVSVRSCRPNQSYGLLSGTSMAAPHVSGALLLLKEAFPYLSGKDLKLALYHSCTDLGAPGEDNQYGMGIINVYNAYLYLVSKGHVPVPAKVNNDVMLLDVRHPFNGCDKKLDAQLLIENAGTDVLLNVEIVVKNDTLLRSVRWNGSLETGQKQWIDLTLDDLPLGSYELDLILENPNGQADLKSLNNRNRLDVKITDKLKKEAAIEFADKICFGTEIDIPVSSDASNAVNTVWYDQLFDGNILQQGNSFSYTATQPLTQVYAAPFYKSNLGKSVLLEADGTYEDTEEELGLIFDANSQFVLDSITVFSQEKGIRSFHLYNESGDSITSSRRFINKIGKNTIRLSWEVSVGKNYRIVKKEGKPLLSTMSGLQFPYSDPEEIVKIKTGTNGSYYHYFYDWVISYLEPCGRIPYNIVARTDTITEKAAFSLPFDTVSVSDILLPFTNLSLGDHTYIWDMGDQTRYNSRDVYHGYSSPGRYLVSLYLIDDQDCISSTGNYIVVLQETSTSDAESAHQTGFKIFPNPSSGEIALEFSDQNFPDADLQVVNQFGQILQHIKIQGGSNVAIMETGQLPSGIYNILLYVGSKTYVQRFVKI